MTSNLPPLAKLIKSSLYLVNGKVARYEGLSCPLDIVTVYAFRSHAEHLTARHDGIARASKEEINTYLGR